MRVVESTTDLYTFQCGLVGSFTSPGIATEQKATKAFSVSSEIHWRNCRVNKSFSLLLVRSLSTDKMRWPSGLITALAWTGDRTVPGRVQNKLRQLCFGTLAIPFTPLATL